MRYVKLSEEEKRQLEELYKTSGNSIVIKRCLCLLLSDKQNSMIEVSRQLGVDRLTVRKLIEKWDSLESGKRLSALYSLNGQGAKVKLEPVADILPELVDKHNRNLKPILEILENEYCIKVCKSTLHNFLKGTGL